MTGWFSRLFSSSSTSGQESATQQDEATVVVAPAAAEVKGLHSMSWMQRDGMNANYLNWLFDDHNESDLFASQSEKEILAALDKIANSKQSGADLVRRMPGVVPQLLQSLRTEDFSGAELARKISHDVVLVEAVIRIANSSLYKSTETITSIEHAVLVLGQTGLRQLITSVAFKPIIDLKSGHFTKTIAPKIWAHSERCAIATRMLAEGEAIDTFDAFLVGLIQNVGFLVSLRIIDQLADSKQSIGSAGFCNALVSYCRKLSAGIGKEWKFPASVILAIEEQGTTNHPMSPVGSMLETGDYISKLQILTAHERLPAKAQHLLKGLSSKAISCLNELNEMHIEDAVILPN